MSNKNGKVVQPAAEKTLEAVEAPKDPLLEPIVVSEEVRAQAKGFGVDVGRIVDTANLLRERVLGLESGIIMIAQGLDERDKKLQPLVNLAKQVEARKQQSIAATPTQAGSPQQGAGLGGILREIAPYLKDSGGSDPMMKMFMQEVFKAGLESMFMGSALMKTYVQKVAPEQFAEAMRSVEEKAKAVAGT